MSSLPAEGVTDVLIANSTTADSDHGNGNDGASPGAAAAGPQGISGDGVLALLRAWGAPVAATAPTAPTATGSGEGGDDFDAWRAIADQLASSRALSCSSLKNVLQGKVACLLGE